MEGTIKLLLDRLKDALRSLYGSRLKGVYLYGSYARGEPDSESDLDVLIVLDGVPHYAAEVDRTGAIVARLALDYGTSISRVFVSEHDWLNGATPFLMSAREEAVPA